MAFGAAGPLLLPAIADLIQVKSVIVPPHPGLFSALGLLSADQAYSISQSAYTVLSPDSAADIAKIYTAMEAKLRQRLGLNQDIDIVRSFDGQLVGQTWETPFVPVPDGPIDRTTLEVMIANFHDVYAARNGNRFTAISVQGVTYRLSAVVKTDKVSYRSLAKRAGDPLRPIGSSVLRFVADAEEVAQLFAREDLCAGDVVQGPAIIREALSTTYITQNQTGYVGVTVRSTSNDRLINRVLLRTTLYC